MEIPSGVHDKGTVALAEIEKNMRRNPNFRRAGAIATFTGVVRETTSKPGKVRKLRMEAYEEKANEVLARICSDLKKELGIVDVQIHHLLGEFAVGEDLVYVLVAGSHRKHVFPVLEKAVERYKREAPIFKKEYIVSTEGKETAYWTEETSNL